MSSKQGPHAVGMRTPANDHGGRNRDREFMVNGDEAEVMSSKQGPHAVGMRTSANDHGGRNHDAADRTILMRPRS